MKKEEYSSSRDFKILIEKDIKEIPSIRIDLNIERAKEFYQKSLDSQIKKELLDELKEALPQYKTNFSNYTYIFARNYKIKGSPRSLLIEQCSLPLKRRRIFPQPKLILPKPSKILLSSSKDFITYNSYFITSEKEIEELILVWEKWFKKVRTLLK